MRNPRNRTCPALRVLRSCQSRTWTWKPGSSTAHSRPLDRRSPVSFYDVFSCVSRWGVASYVSWQCVTSCVSSWGVASCVSSCWVKTCVPIWGWTLCVTQGVSSSVCTFMCSWGLTSCVYWWGAASYPSKEMFHKVDRRLNTFLFSLSYSPKYIHGFKFQNCPLCLNSVSEEDNFCVWAAHTLSWNKTHQLKQHPRRASCGCCLSPNTNIQIARPAKEQ